MPEIISVMKKLGYSPTEKGVCFGLAAMGAQAVTREEPKPFYDRITRIHNLTNEKIESIIKEKELGKTDDLFYFFDGVSVYHGLSAITEDVKKTVDCVAPRQSIANKLLFKNYNDSIGKKVSKNRNKKFNLADIKEQLICSFTKKELNQFILKLKSGLKKEPFSLMLNHSDVFHTVQLGFSNNHWLVVDHDNVKIYEDEYVDISEIVKEIFPNLTQGKKNKFNFHIDILLSEQTNIDLSWVKKHEISSSQIVKQDKKALVKLINSCAFANQHQILKKIFQHVDIASIANEMISHELPITMLLAEASDSYIKTIDVLFEVIKNSKLSMQELVDLLKGRCENEVDALHAAVYMGNIETVNTFLHTIEEIELTDELRMSLLKADDNNENTSALFVAAFKGYTEIFKALLESIKRLKFDHIKLQSLLEAKNHSGDSALHGAIQENHLDIIVALVETIVNLNVSDQEKVILLESRNATGVPGLLYAFAQNKIEITKYLFEYILSSNIAVDKKIELLQSNAPSCNTCLYKFAETTGNKEFMKYLEETIANSSQFTEMQKKQFFK